MFNMHEDKLHDDMEQKMETGNLTPDVPTLDEALMDEALYDESALLGADLQKLLAEEKELLEMLSAPADFAARIDAAVAAADAAAEQPAPAPATPTKVYVPKKKSSPVKMLASLAAVAVLAIGLIGFGGSGGKVDTPQKLASAISITAAVANDDGMDTESPFLIRANEPLEEELVELALAIEPAIEYSLKSTEGGKVWQVIPADDLSEDTVYKLSFDPQRALAGLPARAANVWAFQTKADFGIEGTLPAHRGTNVPTSSVISIAFSNKIDGKTLADRISVEPHIEYELSGSGNQYVLVPQQPLQGNTVYTVDIAAGVANADGTEKLDAYSFSFQTGTVNYNDQNWQYSFSFANEGVSFLPDEVPAFRVYTSANTVLETAVWQLKDAEQYLDALSYGESRNWWCYSSTNNPYPTDGLTLLEQQTLITDGNSSWQSTLTLPRQFEAGYYLLTATNAQGYTEGLVFQVSELSAYAAFGGLDVLVWLHDLSSGQAVEGATVSALDGSLAGSAKTDANGVAIAENAPVSEDFSSRQTLLVEAGGKELVLSKENYDRFYGATYGVTGIKNDYWGYLYTDRVLYRPGETVQFFGIFDSRGEAAEVSRATLKLTGGNGLYGDSAIQIPVEVNDGVVSGSYELPQLSSGYYYLALCAEGNIDSELAGAYFMVDYYSTSGYEISTLNNKSVFMAGETLEVELSANYFEGSPLPDLGISFTPNWDYSNVRRYSTDADGQVDIDLQLPQLNTGSLTSSYSLNYTTSEAQMGDQYIYDSVTVFNWDIYPQLEYERSSDNLLDITLTPYDIDLSYADEHPSTHYYGLDAEKFYKEFSGNLQFEVIVERQEMVERVSTYYDSYTMQTVTDTWTERVPVVEDRFTITVDGIEELQLQLESDWNYYIYLNGRDKAGRTINASYYIYTPALNNAGNEDAPFDTTYVYLASPETAEGVFDGDLALGESATFCITDGYGRSLPADLGGETLFFTYQQAVRDYTASANDGLGYTFTFDKAAAPAIGLMGVWFDGYQYLYTYGRSVWYDYAAQELQLEISTDAEEYAPGAEVKLQLLLKDAEGKPVEGFVNLSLVDEALLALADQNVRFLNNVYYNYVLAYYNSLSSNVVLNDNSMAEGGGEGDGERKDFADTAYFGTVKTDADGKAEVSFTLPDNITAWRLVWHGYNRSSQGALVQAGSGETQIISTLPFFLDYDLADVFHEGDSPVIAIRSAGAAALAAGGEVKLTVAIDELNFKQEITAEMGERVEVALPQLPLGNYEISIIGELGEYYDWMTRSFSVVESFSAYIAKETELLREGSGLNGSEELLTTLVFGNEERATLLYGLADLAGGDGLRLEQRVASLVAREYLAEYFGREEMLPEDEEMQSIREALLAYHKYNGGLASFTYADANPYVSALAASTAAEYFSHEDLAYYFNNLLNSTITDERYIALWGLAALGEPVLLNIHHELENADEMTALQQLYLAMALHFAGDGQAAEALAEDLLAVYTEDLGDGIYRAKPEITAGGHSTAMLAVLAAAYNMPQAEGLYIYLCDNFINRENAVSYNPFQLERLLIMQSLLANHDAEELSFSYRLNGEKVDVDLAEMPFYRLTVTPEQLAEIKISNVSGEIYVTSLYTDFGTLPESEGEVARQIKVSRTYNGQYGGTVTKDKAARVLVSLTVEFAAGAPAEHYLLTDFLPAGLDYLILDARSSSDTVWFLDEEDRQLQFNIQRSGTGKQTVTVNYYARMTMEGEFTADAPYLRHITYADLVKSGTIAELNLQ